MFRPFPLSLFWERKRERGERERERERERGERERGERESLLACARRTKLTAPGLKDRISLQSRVHTYDFNFNRNFGEVVLILIA